MINLEFNIYLFIFFRNIKIFKFQIFVPNPTFKRCSDKKYGDYLIKTKSHVILTKTFKELKNDVLQNLIDQNEICSTTAPTT